jgi:hypothetical protein
MKQGSSQNILEKLLYRHLSDQDQKWIKQQLEKIFNPPAARILYLTYSLIGRKIPTDTIAGTDIHNREDLKSLNTREIKLNDLARIYLLSTALERNPEYFVPKVATLIQVSDTGELIALLKYLVLLPRQEAFCDTAVEALRTNIATVFDAISMDNPYPQMYFNEQQWNQMYLKAAFMQRDLLRIQGVEERANAALSRIISDYAHERWAASRDVDPLFWRPVSDFLDETLLDDMERLLSSQNIREQQAGFLTCLKSGDERAAALIQSHPLKEKYENESFDWKDLKKE